MTIINEKLNEPKNLKELNNKELSQLTFELREEIIRVVSTNGGHLSSNLGVVELTIALLRQFDFCKDRIVWDVGHQTYAYKMLTGRFQEFCSLRQKGGLSGFPKRGESKYDSFNTGHSSTSVSAALGMVRANHLKGIQDKVIAVIGDGALTGGMAFEALNDAGQAGLDFIVILNDNQMSITQNVGGLSKHLESIRVSKRYLMLKMKTSGILEKTRIGQFLSDFIEHMKALLRFLLRSKKMIFEDLGFKYYGPIDGHDIDEIERYLSSAKKMKGPILIHVLTQKGKGYEFAEKSPEKFHGIAPFEISNGMTLGSKKSMKNKFPSFSMAFGKFLTDFAKNDSSITAVCAAMPGGTGLEQFFSEFPKRFFDVGIAEQHAITMAAGMASAGLKPVVAIYSTFLQRAFDQLLHDVALQGLHVVLCIDRAGIVGEDGETHQGIYDLALLTTIPSIEILSPRNYKELHCMMYHALYFSKGPVAIRYPRGGEKTLPDNYENIREDSREIHPVFLKTGKDLTIITEGTMAEKGALAAIEIEKNGYSCELIDICSIKPIEKTLILESIQKTKRVITVENAITRGGLGSEIEKLIAEHAIQARIITIGVSDHPLFQGKIEELYEQEGMDVPSIVRKAIALIEEKYAK